MKIQHNIPAMNSYRNYSNNVSAVAKNLEKLSSGYRINRAGDDAAGLAISEKMRAQITGLATAQKNAKDGISLIQTAEGALTEVHSMLNRMFELAEQSANGVYDNEVDRANLQKEFDALRSEIDRIADSSNFNGQKLLDGSLSGGTAGGKAIDVDLSKIGLDIELTAADVTAVKGLYTTSDLLAADVAGLAAGDSFTMTVNYTDADGNSKSKDITLKVGSDGTNTNGALYLDDGSENGVLLTAPGGANGKLATAGTVLKADLAKAFAEAIGKDDDLKANFVVADSTNGMTFTARAGGSEGAVLNSFTLSQTKAGTTTTIATKVDVTNEPKDANKSYDLAAAKQWDGKQDTLEDSIIEINGKKFAFYDSSLTLNDDQLKMLNDAGVEHWVGATAAGTTNAEVTEMAEKIAKETGLKVEVATGGTTVTFGDGTTGKGEGGGLTLQIGDTSDDYNMLTVSVDDMHCKSLGIDASKININEQGLSQKAMDSIKNAINMVSSTRGDLGALQNRLDHTINNLSVMEENIQDAESAIRDTDVAKEMMAYTKNNILVQSAQAMLAQANQLPQGVLQLLG